MRLAIFDRFHGPYEGETFVDRGRRYPMPEIDEAEASLLRLIADNAGKELVELARANDREGFFGLASLLMPPDKVEECWDGLLGLMK